MMHAFKFVAIGVLGCHIWSHTVHLHPSHLLFRCWRLALLERA